jgi:hypothetical protein
MLKNNILRWFRKQRWTPLYLRSQGFPGAIQLFEQQSCVFGQMLHSDSMKDTTLTRFLGALNLDI